MAKLFAVFVVGVILAGKDQVDVVLTCSDTYQLMAHASYALQQQYRCWIKHNARQACAMHSSA
jgi:hypothetical protein